MKNIKGEIIICMISLIFSLLITVDTGVRLGAYSYNCLIILYKV